MRPLIVHASSKAETDHPRRVLHIEYVDSLEVDDGLRIIASSSTQPISTVEAADPDDANLHPRVR